MDIVIVTYNSEKWIKRCLDSLLKAKALSSDLKLFFVDNHSSDQTVELLTAYKKKYDFSRFEIIQQEQNQGFGNANNLGASFGKDEIVCFLNVDTEVFEDTFKRLEEIIAESSKEIGAWEFRQLPYEHPKIYDPVTGITSWMSGAAFAVRREIFEKLQGFDKNIFMYAEDVDFSWRLRASDYKIKYCPTVKIMHYSYESIGAVKPAQYVNSLINNLLLRYRFGSFSDVMRGYFQFAIVFFLHRAPIRERKNNCFRLLRHIFHVSLLLIIKVMPGRRWDSSWSGIMKLRVTIKSKHRRIVNFVLWFPLLCEPVSVQKF